MLSTAMLYLSFDDLFSYFSPATESPVEIRLRQVSVMSIQPISFISLAFRQMSTPLLNFEQKSLSMFSVKYRNSAVRALPMQYVSWATQSCLQIDCSTMEASRVSTVISIVTNQRFMPLGVHFFTFFLFGKLNVSGIKSTLIRLSWTKNQTKPSRKFWKIASNTLMVIQSDQFYDFQLSKPQMHIFAITYEIQIASKINSIMKCHFPPQLSNIKLF